MKFREITAAAILKCIRISTDTPIQIMAANLQVSTLQLELIEAGRTPVNKVILDRYDDIYKIPHFWIMDIQENNGKFYGIHNMLCILYRMIFWVTIGRYIPSGI